MHTMQPDASGSEDTIHLLQLAIKQQDTQVCIAVITGGVSLN